jgi:hypothetical protein
MGWSVSQFCVDLVFSIVIHLERRLFGLMASHFFAWFADLLSLPNFHLALTLLGYIAPQNAPRDDSQAFIKHQASAIIRRCYGVISTLAQEHWHYEVKARAEEALKIFTQLSPSDVLQEQRRKKAEEKPPQGKRSWLKIASSVDWSELNGTEKQMNDQIATLYHPTSTIKMNSIFMPGPRDQAAKELYKEAFKRINAKTAKNLD